MVDAHMFPVNVALKPVSFAIFAALAAVSIGSTKAPSRFGCLLRSSTEAPVSVPVPEPPVPGDVPPVDAPPFDAPPFDAPPVSFDAPPAPVDGPESPTPESPSRLPFPESPEPEQATTLMQRHESRARFISRTPWDGP